MPQQNDLLVTSRITAILSRGPLGYIFSVFVIGLASLIAWLLVPYFSLVNIVMIFVLAVVFVAFFTGRGPSVVASLLASLSFGLFYVPPTLSLSAGGSQYLLTLSVMMGLSLLISGLTARWREKALEAASKQQEQSTLYAYTRQLAAEPVPAKMAALIAKHLAQTWGGKVTLYEPLPKGGWQSISPQEGAFPPVHVLERAWRVDSAKWETESGPICLPLHGVAGPVSVVYLAAPNYERLSQGRELLEAMLTSGAVALERAKYGEEAEEARMHVEAERLRNSLLSAVSHDLRTPLAIIVGASSSLAESKSLLDEKARGELTQVVYDESIRMRDLVENLLDMARFEAGPVTLRNEWQAFEEVLGVVLKTARPRLGSRTLKLKVPNDLPLMKFDSGLVERVLSNLLENTVKYTPADAEVIIQATDEGNAVKVCVLDNGPGLGKETERVFKKFWRAKMEGNTPGAGLGLSICRSIIEAHGGRIWAENRAEGGAMFCFTLPRPDEEFAELPMEMP